MRCPLVVPPSFVKELAITTAPSPISSPQEAHYEVRSIELT